MKEEGRIKYLEIKELFNRMSHEISLVIESYNIWRTLTFSRSIPEVGEEKANKTAKLMSLYSDFFKTTEQNHLQAFVICLMKFFDNDRQALSILGLIKQIKKNESLFTVEVMHLVHPTLSKIGAIEDSYLPIDQSTIDQISDLREPHESLIVNLKTIRDKQFAHTDLKPIQGTFVPIEVEALIDAVQKMFNKLSGKFDLSSTNWDHMKEDAIRSTSFLLENLDRGESQRQEEIRKKLGL